MKIDPFAPSATPPQRTSKGASASSSPSSSSSAGGADAVQGAKAAVQLSSGQVHSLPETPNADFDAARVASIREDIRAGRYEVHPERIADGLLASVRDLLGDKGRP